MTDVALRKISVSDDVTLAALCATSFKQAYEGVHSTENLQAYCAANYNAGKVRALLANASTHCKIATRDGADVGYCLLVQHACPVPLNDASVELKQIYMLAREYGSGLARILFDDALETARALGAKHVWLAVADSNTRAQAFYRKLGFENVGAGPVFEVGTDRLTSRLLARAL